MDEANLFCILNLRREEGHHDLVLTWLLDPKQPHGLQDFASDIVERLWDVSASQRVIEVKRQFALSETCYPDVAVKFEAGLLIVENKVNAGALRPDQLLIQNELGRKCFPDGSFYHVLLCPDRLEVDGYCVDDPSFRVLRYSLLAELIQKRLEEVSEPDASAILRQYCSYIGRYYGKPRIANVRRRPEDASRQRRVQWSRDNFMAKAQEVGTPGLAAAQEELLELLEGTVGVEARFDSAGPTNATYKIYLESVNEHVLWVYADGRVYARWGGLRVTGHEHLAEVWRRSLEGTCDTSKGDGSMLRRPIPQSSPGEIVELLAETLEASLGLLKPDQSVE